MTAASETNGSPGPDVSPAAGDHERDALQRRIAKMPREVGVLLVTIGVLGVALPGLVGTPALLAGGLLLWPRGFRSVDAWLARRCPGLHHHGTAQLMRFLDDMERRYPNPPDRRD